MTNHVFNFGVRLYTQGATNTTKVYTCLINAKNKTHALYLSLKRFYKIYPNIEITRARVYSVIKNNHKKIKIDI